MDSQKVADHNITINEAQQRGIGELVFNMDATQDPSYDNTVYKEVSRTGTPSPWRAMILHGSSSSPRPTPCTPSRIWKEKYCPAANTSSA